MQIAERKFKEKERKEEVEEGRNKKKCRYREEFRRKRGEME